MAFRAATSSGTGTTNKPTGTVADDAIVLFAASDGNAATFGWPSGFVQQNLQDITGPDGQTAAYAVKLATASEPATYAVTGGSNTVIIAASFSGRDISSLANLLTVAGVNTKNQGSNTSPITLGLTGLTAGSGDDLLLLSTIDVQGGADVWSTAPPAGFTARLETYPNQWANACLISKDNAASGATGTLNETATRTSGSSNAGWIGYVVSLKAAAGGGAQSLTPSLFSNTNTFYDPTVGRGSVSLTPSLFSNSNTFYASVLSSTYPLTPSVFSNTNTFYAPTVGRGAVALTPGLFSNSNTFYSATVGRGAVGISPSLFSNSNTFYSATVGQGALTIAPDLFANDNTFYAATIGVGDVGLTPILFTNTNTFYSATIGDGSIVVPATETYHGYDSWNHSYLVKRKRKELEKTNLPKAVKKAIQSVAKLNLPENEAEAALRLRTQQIQWNNEYLSYMQALQEAMQAAIAYENEQLNSRLRAAAYKVSYQAKIAYEEDRQRRIQIIMQLI